MPVMAAMKSAVESGGACVAEVHIPLEVGCRGLKLGEGALVVGAVGVAALDAGQRVLGEFSLQSEDGFGLCSGGIGVLTDELEHVGDMLNILVAHLLVLVTEVIVAVGEAQATLEEVHDDHVGIFGVGAGTGVEETAKAIAVEVAHQLGQLCLVGHGIHLLEIGKELSVAALIDGHGVHACIVEVTDFLGHAALGGVGVFRCLVDDVLDEDLVVLVNLGEGTIGGVLLRDGVVDQPVVVAIAEEVLRRIDGGVHVAQHDGRDNIFFRLGGFGCFLSATCCQCTDDCHGENVFFLH